MNIEVKAYTGEDIKEMIESLGLLTDHWIVIDRETAYVVFHEESGFPILRVDLVLDFDMVISNLFRKFCPYAFIYELCGFTFKVFEDETNSMQYLKSFPERYAEAVKVAELFQRLSDRRCVFVEGIPLDVDIDQC